MDSLCLPLLSTPFQGNHLIVIACEKETSQPAGPPRFGMSSFSQGNHDLPGLLPPVKFEAKGKRKQISQSDSCFFNWSWLTLVHFYSFFSPPQSKHFLWFSPNGKSISLGPPETHHHINSDCITLHFPSSSTNNKFLHLLSLSLCLLGRRDWRRHCVMMVLL